jgi:23S rRNA (uracil1939-C5)-methyltransferase
MRSYIQKGDSSSDNSFSFGLSFGMFRSVKIQGKWEKEFISWDTCPLHTQPIQTMIQRIRERFSKEDPAFLEHSLVGLWIGSPHIVVVTRETDSSIIKSIEWNQILVPPFNQVWFHCNPQVGRNIFGYRPIERIVGLSEDIAHPIRAFRQVAQSLLIEARSKAVQALVKNNPSWVFDLYCGTGELSVLLPSEMGWIGIEQSKEAVKYANGLRDPKTVKHAAYIGSVEQRLNDPKIRSQIVGSYALYLNPPRSGLSDEAKLSLLELLSKNPPQTIVYLSCSASSLRRDLETFENSGYSVQLLQPYDFFPQTEHFETLAVLERKSKFLVP